MNALFFKTAWRNLKRYKFNTAINTGGLVLGFTIGLAVLGVVIYMLGFDKFHKNGDRLYEVYDLVHTANGDQYSTTFAYPAGPAYQKNISSVAAMSRYLEGAGNARYNNKEYNLHVLLVDTGFASMFDYKTKAGNLHNSLQQVNGLALTASTAKKIFGNDNAIGKNILLSDGENMQSHIVTAILEDPPQQSSLQFGALARIETVAGYANLKDNWNHQNHQVFVMLRPGVDQKTAEAQFRRFNKSDRAETYHSLQEQKALKDKNGDEFVTLLQPVPQLHFAKKLNPGALSYSELLIVAAIGMMIILIACFNFININLAQAFLRSKEIGVRKCLGAGQANLVSQLWVESFIVCAIAFLFSLLGLYFLIDQLQANGMLTEKLGRAFLHPAFIAGSVGLLLLVSLIAGGYPSWVMARFEVVDSLKGKILQSGKHRLRNGLMVFQFVIACIMISCTMVVYNQFQYLQSADMGMDRSYVISVPLQNGKNGKSTVTKLRQRLANEPGVISVTGSSVNVGRGRDGGSSRSRSAFGFEGKQINTDMVEADYDYAKTLGLTLLAGRDLETGYGVDTNYTVLMSASAAKQFGGESVVGRSLLVDSAQPRWQVAGVFKDFHLYSMHEEAAPLTVILDPQATIDYALVKTSDQRAKQTMAAVEKEMKILEPDADFKGSFIEENIQKWYVQEKTMSQLFSIAALLAIVLSCTGLLAMVMQVTRQRMKEIGIRKVLGAGVWQLSWLVSVSFLKLVTIAIIIALPISWMMMHNWLQKFPFRINLTVWQFLVVAMVALVIAAVTMAFNTFKAAMQNPVNSIRTD
ncbi:MAG: ABC transporter permease [Bacteroidetes bacterium]|nr:ABC transporter permease [Bacteroidota bacterium]